MSNMPVPPCVHAVVVTYLPDVSVLRELLAALGPQVACVHIVDNTPQADTRVPTLLHEMALGNAHLLRLGENLGIARALNEGVAASQAASASHVFLSDQDSLPPPDMLAGLLRAERELVAQGMPVGAVGPTFTEAHTRITFPFQVDVPGKFFYGHAHASVERPLVETLSLITSGCLIRSAVWDAVGPMREDFFIDYVDVEWSHRARAAGFRLYGTVWATMAHSMGDAQLRVWYFGWRRESAYGPLRIYYRVRNFLALCRLPYILWQWKLRSGWYCLGLIYAQTIFGQQRLAVFRLAMRGLWDGLRGHMGRYPDNQRRFGKS